ncbi:MAG TPA: 3-isopropylmalate dehydratase small subunit [Acidimicrobiia bacterium]|jgi:3-isopropylmalate/(R)-2-methylmalate dehydratase small subunit
MEPVNVVSGRMAPLPRANVDTDQIMPKQFLKRVERTGYGQFLFHDWCAADPDFVILKPEYQGARILVTGANFGCGSSREHAPWGLQDWGFRAVVASSFGDIFRSNCTKIGLLPVELPEGEVQQLLALAAATPEATGVIDLAAGTITASDPDRGVVLESSFDFDEHTRWRLLNGLDDIGLTLAHEDGIAAYEARRSRWLPTVV